jgi:hypothetical protein
MQGTVGLIGIFLIKVILKPKSLTCARMPRPTRKNVKQSLKPRSAAPLIPATSTMASAESVKDPTTEAEKDVWKKTEQQFTTYGREVPSLPKLRNTNRSTGSAAQSTSILVKILPMRVSNVCVGITTTRKCVKTTSSTNLPSDPRPEMQCTSQACFHTPRHKHPLLQIRISID